MTLQAKQNVEGVINPILHVSFLPLIAIQNKPYYPTPMLLAYLFHLYTRLLLILILIIGSFYIVIQMNFQDDKSEQKPTITVETFQTIDGWGYSIFKDEHKIIKQSYIPAVSGYRPFTTSIQAYQTALLVKEKLENEEVPLITIEDLTTLGIDTK